MQAAGLKFQVRNVELKVPFKIEDSHRKNLHLREEGSVLRGPVRIASEF